MDINEIAKLAGVSPSTVSKVVNHRDSSISETTRKRVLKVVRQYHYTPYAKSRAAKPWVIGVVFRSSIALDSTIDGILSAAQANGYSVLVFTSEESIEQETKNMAALAGAGVTGIIWEPVSMESLRRREELVPKSSKLVTIGINGGEDSLMLPYESAARELTRELIERGHSKIACLVEESRRTRDFVSGFRRQLFESGMPCSDSLINVSVNANLIDEITRQEITGIVCSHYRAACELKNRLAYLHYRCPEDFSIVSLRNDTSVSYAIRCGETISTCTIRNADFGYLACQKLISLMRNEQSSKILYHTPGLDNLKSIGAPPTNRLKRITVIGSINIDTRLAIPHLPTRGMTVSTEQSLVSPGGKGVNEAIGAARLGCRVSLIGNVGDDHVSSRVYRILEKEGVDASGVFRKAGSQTGHAYIMVEPSGESQITILPGANATLSAKDIEEREEAFKGTKLCLVQSEIPADAVLAACVIARRHGAKTILKPTSAEQLDNKLLANVDYLIPNQNELEVIAPGHTTLEERARALLNRGVGAVITTLGAQGCYLCTRNQERRFAAVPFPTIDATGAGDAFISAFAASILDEYSVVDSIKRAIYAAGYSTSRQGVVDALIDKDSLDSVLPLERSSFPLFQDH